MRTHKPVAFVATIFLTGGLLAVGTPFAIAHHLDHVEPTEYEAQHPEMYAEPEPEPELVADQAAEAPGYAVPSGMAEALAALRFCESSNDYGANTGNGYYGAYQFSLTTWQWLGYSGYPHLAPPWVQDEAAVALYNIYGWSPWPGCSASLGLR